MPHSGPHFLSFWCDLVPKSLILGAPWRPAGHQMAPKIAQVAPKTHQKSISQCYQEPLWKRSPSRSAFGALLGTILVDFEWILGSMLMDLGIIFDGFWLLLCGSICRRSKPPGTKRNSGKHQEHPDNCRNTQTSNARKNESPFPIERLQAAECK